MSRFALGRFALGRFARESFRPYLVSRFALIFLPCPNVSSGVLFVIYNLRICLGLTIHNSLWVYILYFGKNNFEQKTQSACLNFIQKRTSTPVIFFIQNDFNRYQNQQKQIMRTKNIHQVQHDFWKEIPKAKQMLLVDFQLRQNYMVITSLGRV